jgi:2-polyprenyl-3-methyl-5-hydroxy-6-metoxy-1,4-benzoquinol methylase
MLDRQAFYDQRAARRPAEQKRTYNRLLRQYYRFFVTPGARVLEVGCGVGDLLAALEPCVGIGIDFSRENIEIARSRHREHRHLSFHTAEAASFQVDGKFDYIILSDLVNDVADVQAVLEHVRKFAHERTRLVLNFFNHAWRPVLALAEKLELKAPTLPQNWLSASDMQNLLHLAGWEMVKQETKILSPVGISFFERLLNRLCAPVLTEFCLTIFQVARLRSPERQKDQYTCSVVIPARNEEGNIEAAVQRIPELGAGTEIIFIEGHSKDKTWQEINRVAEKYPERRIKILKQKSKGKAGAVREAFEVATGDILMILDADLTMPPEQLSKFYEVLRSGAGEFVNGVRLVYPMEQQAMQFLNMVANKFFGLAFSWLLGQPVKDTLCGTKVLFRRDYQEIARNRSFFGDFDPFGDFDLLFGAARLNLKIADLPIRYQARTYGETNIQRWRHGALLFRMVGFAATRLKFI